MLCKCGKKVDDLSFKGIIYKPGELKVCSICRHHNYPEYLPVSQYSRYWIEFSKKWRNRIMVMYQIFNVGVIELEDIVMVILVEMIMKIKFA